jgi:hypothetical protein
VTNLRHVVAVIKSWVDRQPVRNVKITLGDDTLELTGASADDQRRLVDAWISRHAVPG